MTKKVDVAIIGGGPGGTPAAMQLAKQGKKVLLVEESGKLGGACLFVGCIPSKIIRHEANVFSNAHSGNLEISSKDRNEVWNKIMSAKEMVLQKRSNGAMMQIKSIPNIIFSDGMAKFVSKNEIAIDKNGEVENYEFDNAIVATGAKSIIPPFKGNALNDILTSEVLFSQKSLPDNLLIVGGGPIGVEIAGMLSKLGVKCTIVEMMESLLYGIVDTNFSSDISKNLEELNIKIHTSSKVTEINKKNDTFDVIFEDKSGNKTEQNFGKVLIVTGKSPNMDYLNLESAGIEFSKQGIIVNDNLETSVNGIYATGDVINTPKFAHTATYEAGIAVSNILFGNEQKVDYEKNSWVLFSDPEIAVAGLTEKDAKSAGYDFFTGIYDYKIDASAQVANFPFGYLKFIVEKKSLRVLGIHILHKDAATLAGEAALIVSNKLTLKNILAVISPHPTATEAFSLLAMNMLSQMKK